ncbi:hypothetical protein AX15_000074 [Amanita polypyramis BW_CC]|nr:hypothetical protein AX15_000074 [Amanita polypyramis BW_CC]
MGDVVYDPFTINLRRQTRLLSQKLPQNSPYAVELSNVTSVRGLLLVLSRLLAKAELTEVIAAMFRPILTDLCARWIEGDDCTNEQLFAIALLVEVQEELYPVLDRILRKPRFRNGPLGFFNAEAEVDTPHLHSLLVAYFRILQANQDIPEMFSWPLMPLSSIIWSEKTDNATKLLAIRCYAVQSTMGEAERENLEREVLRGEPFEPECPLEYGKNLKGEECVVDGWMLPVIERERVQKWRNDILGAISQEGYYTLEDGDVREWIDESDLSPFVVNIYGVLLLRSAPPTSASPASTLISTPSTTAALRTLATHVSLRLPTLLTSSPSAGKSLLLTHLAHLLHPQNFNHLITIHLADTSLDPRALLGSYVSSPTSPGTFEWKEGVLVRAMREGRWVVFEDVDKASSEVLGTIRPLIESMRLGRWIGQHAELDIPGKGKVVALDSFRVFATRSVKVLQCRSGQRESKIPTPVFLGAHKFWEVVIESPAGEELRTILDTKYPKLRGEPGKSLINLWEEVRNLGAMPGGGAGGGREVGVRELEKFCTRVESLLPAGFHFSSSSPDLMDIDEDNRCHTEGQPETPVLPLPIIFANPSLREDIFGEARDVFFGAGALMAPARAYAETVSKTIGTLLGFDDERRNWLLNGRTPPFTEEKDVNGRVVAVCAGYTRLAAKSSGSASKREMEDLAQSFVGQKRPFVMHKPAVVLLSRIARAVALHEPVLLTGETGTGKTSAIAHLAGLLRRKLISLNLSHQTESGDLLGGFKPVDARVLASVLMEQWEELFGSTFSRRKNEKFEGEVRKAARDARWSRVVGLWRESGRLARDRIRNKKEKSDKASGGPEEVPRKRRKVEQGSDGLKVSEEKWAEFLRGVDQFEVQHVHAKGKFAFDFVEGPLVKALRSGDWILLDEINLASPETLECITGLLHGPTASITITEQGSLEPVPRHPDFRLFACMNPATDVGKKDLPPNIRTRFTEIDVPPPDADKETLLSIVKQYIENSAVGDKASIMNVAEFYQNVKALAEQRQIADGANHRPHYSMRSLTRALTFANDIAVAYGFPLRRALWEGCLMAFTMVLDKKSADAVTALAHKHILAGVKNPHSLLTKEPNVPRGRSRDEYTKFGPFYLEKGPHPEDPTEEYIITPSVETKLIDLARIVLTRRFPVLIEGPTSSGKTSAVEYLASRTGHRFVRINNHEHTDIQEYIGSYVSDPLTGKLVFKDGLLVRALRNGDWIVLDELNLAPTDVLEALNRLLDDNRELVIPETQEVVRPHPHFMLFATQNPPGLYAGRKVLSRAFRNRFLEVHFEDVPQAELETILCERCRIAPSYGKKIVAVFRELQKRRHTGRVFESKHGFATLRDLFRWAGRDAVGYQELAENGYMLIGERARREDDKAVVREVIENIMGVRIDERTIYDFSNPNVADMSAYLGCLVPSTESAGVVWTSAMQRLFILVCRALRSNEPVLLVGETGSGKTSVCQVYADSIRQKLVGLNCHQNTETADLIGGLRPVRNRSAAEMEAIREVSDVLREIGVDGTEPVFNDLATALNEALKSGDLDEASKTRVRAAQQRLLRLQSIFEWHDGPLVEAMRNGDVFLLDEISLADDSVLERLNSVLEPSRTIVLAEKGGEDSEQAAVKAREHFKLVATMNPGGDYGKKELSPALRNRFTEIWVPPVEDRKDLELIVGSLWKGDSLRTYTKPLLDFIEWLCSKVGDRSVSNLRDILAWVAFTNSSCQSANVPTTEIFHHAAHMTFLDGLSSLPQLSSYSKEAIQKLKADAEVKLEEIIPLIRDDALVSVSERDSFRYTHIGPFAIPKGPKLTTDHAFNLQAPTTRDNAMRIARACQLAKPILLEGSPGVGKTSLVTALANVAGYRLCRINLSDQTDLIDLFGSDLPVEGGGPGEFAWRDAEFLRAMQQGDWVLLDEMNLAPQAVLEGLNAVLDHRGTVYIPELGRSFSRHPSFRIFAAQNPLTQGGGRKGLPKSFINRFTKVYVEELSPNDLSMICQELFPELDEDVIRGMIAFNMRLNDEVCLKRSFARQGSPWEFNLRDVIRWGCLLRVPGPARHPVDHLRSIYLHRFRTKEDRVQARALFDQTFGTNSERLEDRPPWTVSSQYLQIGYYTTVRKNLAPKDRAPRIMKRNLATLESMGLCASQSWLAILTGPQNCGKTEVVRLLAHFTGNVLREISINSSTDAMDILGSFEQVDDAGRIFAIAKEILVLLDTELRSWPNSNFRRLQEYRQVLHSNIEKHQTAASSDLLQLCLRIVEDMKEPTSREILLTQLHDLFARSNLAGRFEWVDGPLVQAMRSGYWLLLDNANLCNPSVLDRLNSLCEPDGFLTLSERGFVGDAMQIIKPHPNFRLFMTVDPQYGELSRAMRNRGIEVALIDPLAGDDSALLLEHLRYPVSVEHRKDLCLQFDHARRGFYAPIKPLALSSIHSSGRLFSQDSALSYIIDQVPAIIGSSLANASLAAPYLQFIARTIVPQYKLVYMRRDTTGRDIRDFLEFVMTVSFASLGKPFTVLRAVPSDFVLCQPMDFFLVNPSSLEKSLEEKDTIGHHALLQILDFAVAVFLHEKDSKGVIESFSEASSKGPSESAVVTAVNSLLKSIQDASQRLLESLRTADIDQTDILKVLTKALGYGYHLRRVLENSLLDYSGLFALARSILDILSVESPHLDSLQRHARDFSDAVSLTSGLGLFDIWSSLYCSNSSYLPKPSIARLDELASSLNNEADATSLRKRTFDYLALVTMPFDHDPKNPTLVELRKGLEQLLGKRSKCCATHRRVDSTSLVIELNLFAFQAVNEESKFKKAVRQVIELTASFGRSSLLRIVGYKQMLWCVEAGRRFPPLTAHMHLQWLQDTWDLEGQDDEESRDPLVLIQPTLLKAAFHLNDWKQQPLAALSDYERQIERQARMIILQCDADMNRSQQLVSFLYQSLHLIAQCFMAYLPQQFVEGVRSTRTLQDLWVAITEIVSAMEQARHQALVQAVRCYIRPAIDNFAGSRHELVVGKCWMAISLLLFELIIPSRPVDPAAIQNLTSERLKNDMQDLSVQITLHRKLEDLLTGNLNNAMLRHLQDKLESVASQLSGEIQYPVRRDLPRLHMYWAEITQFRDHVLAQTKLHHLDALLGQGREEGKLQEQVMQQSISGFYQRLDGAYADFADVNVPLKLSMLYLRFGLRLTAQVARRTTVSDINHCSKLAAALAIYPSISDFSILSQGEVVPMPTIPAIQYVILQIAAISFEKSLGIDLVTRINQVDLSYQQALHLWLIDRAKDQERDEAANPLYRHTTTHNEVSEAEVEEREFLALFPSFEDILSQETPISSDNKAHRPSKHVLPEDAIRIVEMYTNLLAGCNPSISKNFTEIRMSFLESLLQLPTLPASLDDNSLPLQLSILSDRLSRLRIPDDGKGTYDFYSDSNVSEAKKALRAVEDLKMHLYLLMQDWPEQMVLRHLQTKCDVFLGLGVSSPLAKLLSALEQLLMQTDDWEIYANKENSLKTHRQSLTNIIIDWRRLELSCWRTLLDSQAKEYAAESSTLWFRLYDACIRGALDACQREGTGQSGTLSGFLNTLIPLLDDYIYSSTLGQFHTRLQFLRTFECYISHLKNIRTEADKSALDRVQRVLCATVSRFGLYSSSLANILQEQKAGLEKEIQEFIKLASWKDTNVLALKASAHKTHHQLFKVVRKFREVLKQPVQDKLSLELAGDVEAKPLESPDVNISPIVEIPILAPYTDEPSANLRPHLSQLKRTFARYNNLINTRIRPFISALSPHIADNFATEVIVRARELSNTVILTATPAEKRQKQQKALLVRKRKGWSDLLKELKRAGFSENPKPRVLQNLADERWLREQPILVDDDEKTLSTDRVEVYLSRLHTMMPRLRSSLSSHHSDISTRELRRGVMFLESGFSISIDLRQRLAEAVERFNKLLKSYRRLRMLAERPKIAGSGPGIVDRVRFFKDILCRLSSALREILQGIVVFNKLQPQNSIPQALLEDVETVVGETDVIRDRLVLLLQSIQLSAQAILIEDEQGCIISACRHIGRIRNSLQSWSQEQPQFDYLVRPVSKWIDSQDLSLPLPSSPVQSEDDAADGLIDSLLVAVQSILSNCPEQLPTDVEDIDHYILQQYQTIRDLTYLLNLNIISSRIDDVIVNLASKGEGLEKALQRVMPFIETYLGIVRDQINRHCQWTKALFKLNYVIGSIIYTVSEKGFCKPPDAGDAEKGAETSDTAEGVGLGEGAGAQNVSNEIEDESQVEGLKDEGGDDERDRANDDNDAIEMREDVGGDMEDVQEGTEDEESGSENESEVDPEERLGKLDGSDPSAVDEKLWGDEKGPENSEQGDDKTNRDHGEEQSGESKVVAKEGKRKEEREEKENAEENAPESNDAQEDGEEMEEDIGEKVEDKPGASGAPLDEHIPDADTLDLPDDMKLEDQEMGSSEAEQEEEVQDEIQEEVQEADEEESVGEADDQRFAEDQGMEDEGQAGGEVMEQQEPEPEENENAGKEEVVAQADISAGEGGTESTQPLKEGSQGQSSAGHESSVAGGPGEEPKDSPEDKELSAPPEFGDNQQQTPQQLTTSSGAGLRAAGTQQGQANTDSNEQTEANPLRSLGDALKEIRQRFDDILSGEKQEIQQQIGDTNVPSQVEYLHPDEADHEMQALGPAGEEQVAKLEDLKLIDDDAVGTDILPMDIDPAIPEQQHEAPPPVRPPATVEPDVRTLRENVEGAIIHSLDSTEKQLAARRDPLRPKADTEMENDSSQAVEAQLVEWHSSGIPGEGGEHIWRLYESLTHDLAYVLCEQLRLILEPTLATRLRGDYRTGKRLNMKKIIPYIASDYTKDKIWLRRTRPSQREYQILIAIDDSRSMAESHSVHLAFQTLSLVAKALSRLEAGDIAIAKFGEAVHMLHNFEDGQFTDQAGTKVISSFRFDQKATNVFSLVETSLKVLESAREQKLMSSATAGDLWQLEIIISDGLCQDHDRLRTLLRKAEEQRVMVVFIIVDSLHSTTVATSSSSQSISQNSILNMDKAEYKLVDGRMELQLQKYLDSFPFEYYVVLRNVEALPEVLAGTLKQFFERISES